MRAAESDSPNVRRSPARIDRKITSPQLLSPCGREQGEGPGKAEVFFGRSLFVFAVGAGANRIKEVATAHRLAVDFPLTAPA